LLFRLLSGKHHESVNVVDPAPTLRLDWNKLPPAEHFTGNNNELRHRSLGVTKRASDASSSSNKTQTCDAAFMRCMDVSQCVDCFTQLQSRDVDWASVTQSTPCEDVISFLKQSGLCMTLKRGQSTDQFCETFTSCVSWASDDGNDEENDNKKRKKKNGDDGEIDCSTLKECDWPGFHPSFIGNGVCNDALYGCYNTQVCGWDGGDCCEDSCKKESNFVDCGHDGYVCRDPESTNCNSLYSWDCKNSMDDDSVDDNSASCTTEQTPYRLIMYDSFGDGWDQTKLVLTEDGSSKELYSGSLRKGSVGTHKICLGKQPTCYNVVVKGGTWGNEVSWEIKPTMDSPAIAGGGAPMDCTFGVAGKDDCKLTW
jgi:hypothetical protein